jgi:S-methylmethionine-dependent homocysteine/selenocysteine methylase
MTGDGLRRRLADHEVVLLDGGTGTELEARGVPMDGAVWSALAVLGHPEVVREVHEDYIRAGAEIVIANTFAANRLALEPAGLGDRVAEINRLAVAAAVRARGNAAERPVLVAGSLTPLGTEIVPDANADRGHVLACFREQAELQAEAGVDLFAVEMVPDALHGAAAAEAARATGLPVLLGLSTAWSGGDATPLEALAAELAGPGVLAVAAMHCELAEVDSALGAIERGWRGPLGAYPHHGGWEPPHWVFHEIAPERFAEAARGWVARGAQLVGGCCGIGPAHIARLREELPSHVPRAG